MCPDPEVKSQLPSPKGDRMVTTYVENCGGATTDFATIVNLHVPNQPFNDPLGDLLAMHGSHDLEVKWIDSEHLQIQCEECTRTDIAFAVVARWDVNVLWELPRVSEF
jgi:hypothetical protein